MILILMIAFAVACLWLAACGDVNNLIEQETRRLDNAESVDEYDRKLARSVD